MDRPKFFIRRYPERESLADIRGAQSVLNDADGPLALVQAPHLTIAGDNRIEMATRQLGPDNLNSLIHPLPDTAHEPITLGVQGLRSVRGSRELPYLMVQLDDDGTYREERRILRGRIERYLYIGDTYDYPPHVSLGRVGLESLTMELVEEIEEQLPDSMTFTPIVHPQYTSENTGVYTEEAPLAVRRDARVMRQAVPRGLLEAMRKQVG